MASNTTQNNLRIIISTNTNQWVNQFKSQMAQVASKANNKGQSNDLNKYELYYRKMLQKKFVETQLVKQSNFQFSSSVVKDFTLTNVRGNATIYDIKYAIEKLKGYSIACQSLTLFDESELFDFNS